MNKYKKLKIKTEEDFKRLTGVHKITFEKMVLEIKTHEEKRKKILGRPLKLSYEDQVLMTLEYLREYRIYYHIANNYEISESNCYKIIKKVEDILVKSKYFKLPSKKEIEKISDENKIILIDATETQIQRPKKNKNYTILGKRKNIH